MRVLRLTILDLGIRALKMHEAGDNEKEHTE